MLLLRLVLPLMLIAFATLCKANTMENVKERLESAGRAVELYNKILAAVIPWEELQKSVDELDRWMGDCSEETGQLVGEIKTHLLNGLDAYFLSTQSIYEWCGTTTYQLSNLYLRLFEVNDGKYKQKEILKTVFNKTIEKLTESQQKLSNISEAFTGAAGKLVSLNVQLTNDFDEKSKYYSQQISRAKALCAASRGAVMGPFELWITGCNPNWRNWMYDYVTPAVNKFIPELNTKMESIKKFHVDLVQMIEKATVVIETTKARLQTEIQSIGELKDETEMTQATLPLDQPETSRDEVTNIMAQLIGQCDDFRKIHAKKE